MKVISAVLMAVMLFASAVHGYIVEVPAKNQECFFESFAKYERMISSFEVLAGGMLDINVKVRLFQSPRCAYSADSLPFHMHPTRSYRGRILLCHLSTPTAC